MEKNSWKTAAIWIVVIIGAAAIGMFLYAHRSGDNMGGGGASSGAQKMSGDGYSFSVPAGWRVEQNASDALAIYPDPIAATSSSMVSCKIEMSVFPALSGTDEASWISSRIGADPSLAVAERSSAAIDVSGGSAVAWEGTIDGVPTTLVYAFSTHHAYEIAPSVINQTTAEGNAPCAAALETFLSQLTLQ